MIKRLTKLGPIVRCVFIVAMLLNGAHAGVVVASNQTQPLAEAAASASVNLVMQAFALIGTKYKLGGSSTETGFDCSGFIRHLYSPVLDFALPRTSFEMSRLGTKVDHHALMPGDLVFFNTLKRSFSHVGIYIGEDRFIHSPSKGRAVEIVDMREQYWQKRFNGARRLFAELPATLMGPEWPPESTTVSTGQ